MTADTIRQIVAELRASGKVANAMFAEQAQLAGVDIDDPAQSAAYIAGKVAHLAGLIEAAPDAAACKTALMPYTGDVSWLRKIDPMAMQPVIDAFTAKVGR